MRMLKRKRSENRNQAIEKWSQIDQLMEDILQEEMTTIKENCEQKYKNIIDENAELTKINQALEYKSSYYEQEYKDLYKKYEGMKDMYKKEVRSLLTKVEFVYCVSCDDCETKNILCSNGHANCKDCIMRGIESYVSDQNICTKVPACLKCLTPFEDCQLSGIIDAELWGKFVGERTRMDTISDHNIDLNDESETFTIKRPCCKKKMVDFEGCAALKCEYCENTYYCAFCFEIFKESATCHRHVSSCRYNTEPTYHIISQEQII